MQEKDALPWIPQQGRLRWGDRRDSCSFCIHQWGVGGPRIALHTELFPSLLSSERAFSSIVDSLVHKNCSGGKPPDAQIDIVLLGEVLRPKATPVEEYTYT